MVLDAEGRPDLDSLVLSTAAWGLGRAERPGPGDPRWLDGFEDVTARLRDLVEALVAATETAAETPSAATAASGPSQPCDEVGAEQSAGQVVTAAVEDPERRQDDVRPLAEADLRGMVSATAHLLGLAGLTADWEIRVLSRRVGPAASRGLRGWRTPS